MKILVLNVGSSSLKFSVFDDSKENSQIFKGEFSEFTGSACNLFYTIDQDDQQQRQETLASISEAILAVPNILKEFNCDNIDAIGHRVAHGGEVFHESLLIDDEVIKYLESCSDLAPLHNPSNIKAIKMAQEIWPTLLQIAVFDTAFHHTMPMKAYTYAVPKEWRQLGLRRYGFHGTSHQFISLRIAKELKRPSTDLRIISCHLGNGASICAIDYGFSIDTSMGMTPLEGLVMGTRSGDVDPGIFNFLASKLNISISEIEHKLYHDSGLKALTGSSDLRDVEQKAAGGDLDAQLAINLYAYRVRKYIGSYVAAMGGVDVIAFTGGVGENSASMRRRICDKFEFLGLFLDHDLNQSIEVAKHEVFQIQSYDSRIKVMVTHTSEQHMIMQEVNHILTKQKLSKEHEAWHVPVAVSARHVHLCQDSLDQLFGKGYELKKFKTLSQPGNWAAEETVEVIGPKGSFKKVRILGPLRKQTQIEVSKTDTFNLGVEAPVRPSGKLDFTPSIKLKGPAGEIYTNGLIIAARHIHVSTKDAEFIGLKDGDYVDVRLGTSERRTSFANTLIRVSDDFFTEMHIDTDEANAADINISSAGEIVMHETNCKSNITAHKSINNKVEKL